MSRRGWLALIALAACTDEVVIRPQFDLPAGDLDADAFAAIDELQITVARAGDERELVSQTFARGEPIELAGAPFGDELVVHVTGFLGDTVISYGRTCAFDVAPDGPPPEPHLFFARTLKFASLGVTPLTRTDGSAISFLGSAVIQGGKVGATAVREVERFDPVTGELVTLGQVSERTGAVEALLGTSPARIALIGGELDGVGARFIELIDPPRAIEPPFEDPHMARVGLTATSLTDGRVIAIGGNAPGGAPVGTITELALTATTPEIRDLRASLAYPRTGHTATRLGDDVGAPVLVAGGLDAASAPVAIAELFKPLREELANPATFAPAMVVPRSRHHAVTMPDGSVLFLGGVDATGLPVRTLELFSVDAGFVEVGELPQAAGVVDTTVTPLPDGRVLVTGGRTAVGGAATNTAYIARLDPLDGSVDVVATDRLAVPRAAHHAALLCDGTVLVTGGTAVAEVAERYNPPPAGRR